MSNMKLADISRKKGRNILKPKLIKLKLTVRSKISETCVGGISGFTKGDQPGTNIVKG
jgi:hypothetical protein